MKSPKKYWPTVKWKHSFEIVEKKLGGRPKSWGLCYPSGRIEIDPNQRPKAFLETLVHELLHRQFPVLCEDSVEVAAVEITESLWEMDYRRTIE